MAMDLSSVMGVPFHLHQPQTNIHPPSCKRGRIGLSCGSTHVELHREIGFSMQFDMTAI